MATSDAEVELSNRRARNGGRSEDARPHVSRRNMSGQVVDYIKNMIFDGSLIRGQRVPQDQIAKDLGVSRLPVREALITLEAEGLIDSEPHRGSFVVPILREDIDDHYRIYGMVQGLASRRAASRITQPTLARLQELHEGMQASDDPDLLHNLNWEFHALINQTGGSRRLLSVLRQLAKNLPRAVYEAPPGASPEANRGHQKILDALRSGDATAADAASREHVQFEGEYVIAKLKRDGILADDA
ncbi:GntR family transcriptional regulator [Rhodococcus sp. JS3073]|uniref:GntR family transcriptional regulator n=1 Tax=Rhodococcus sp. JS3073 TaxID=3002901 RepID=UPI00228566B1|nr:GntR family transcriptional regulator [Rhodococcus sp. JS3073]WAM14757.1 GntR family transcriptional regulator [Rhodococcus sp. JS3073]